MADGLLGRREAAMMIGPTETARSGVGAALETGSAPRDTNRIKAGQRDPEKSQNEQLHQIDMHHGHCTSQKH